MRNSFVDALCKAARTDEFIFLITGDLGYSTLEPFAQQFPKQFLNIGIAEQNMVGVAAGLAKEGYKVFVYSIGNFPTLRCMEQIRYLVCYHKLNVNVVAVGAGYAYGPLGTSHHTTEDIGMLRTIPNLLLTSPADPVETKALVRYLLEHQGPCYMRINKANDKILHKAQVSILNNKPLTLHLGEKTDKLVLTTGAISELALDYGLKEDVTVLSFPIISPIDMSWAKDFIKGNLKQILTLEEHQINCGFGSAIIEQLSDMFNNGKIEAFPKVRRIAIPNTFIDCSGTQGYLREKMGLNFDQD